MNTVDTMVWEVACGDDCTPDNSCLVCDSHNDYMGYWG